MNWLSQTIAVTTVTLRSIPQRLGSSVVAIVGIAGVVIVFCAVLSIAEGFRAAMQGSGDPRTVIVMRSGSDTEMTSGFPVRRRASSRKRRASSAGRTVCTRRPNCS